MTFSVSEFAPAKINLALHVTGQRVDGYHQLDSLVVFAGAGDLVTVAIGAEPGLVVTGPAGSGIPAGADNLVMRAADLIGVRAMITLEKHLPVAAGIGGGSSDAAATLLALSQAAGRNLPENPAMLGADVPVCLYGRPCRMSGIGDKLEDVPSLPPLHMVLVNPRVALRTPNVFSALSCKGNAPMSDIPEFADAADLASWLGQQRNDLELPARALAPVVGVVLSRLGALPGCLLARMSGSGATCFGLFATLVEADAAASQLSRLHPDWWITPASGWSRAAS